MNVKSLIWKAFCLAGLLLASCDAAWDSHYGNAAFESDGSVTVYDGDAASFLQSQPDLTLLSGLFERKGLYQNLSADHHYTLVVYPDSTLSKSDYRTDTAYADYCVCDVSVPPTAMTDGKGLRMRFGKNVWISRNSSGLFIDQYRVSRIVKADNAYIYYLSDGVVPIRKSVYEVLESLGNNYSEFKKLVKRYEKTYFDKEHSTPIGYNSEGNTVYKDSVWATKNTLMDRYTIDGLDFWNMRSEDFLTTMLIPSNEVVKAAMDTALAKIPRYLGRAATPADRAKFEKWIVRACFINKRLPAETITGQSDIDCVGGYLKDTLEGKTYAAIEAAMWRPWVQKTRTSDRIQSSNGTCYFVDFLKVPNNVIVYRLKSKFYELWNAMNSVERAKYFRWVNWEKPDIVYNAQGEFQLSESLPTMFYHVLTAEPSKAAIRDSLKCSVTYDGMLMTPSGKVSMANVPAGEYYLRMGFKHSLLYSLSIYFNDSLLVKDMVMYAQGSNFHFDRGSVGVVDYNGAYSIGYPEGYVWKDWAAKSEKAQAYDTDGYQVAIVNVPKDGSFTIKIESSDNAFLYGTQTTRDGSNVNQLMMYHWCLRPTKNNY